MTQVLDWPVGTITWGVGQIGSRTIESLVNEYSSTLDEAKRLDVKQIASGLSEFIGERFRNAFPGAEPTLGIQVAGYSPDHFFPEQYILGWGTEQDGEVANVRPDNPDGSPAFGANWYGDAAAIVRLYKGFEPAAIEALVKAGVRKDVADKITRFEYPVVFEAMPLQDAIDFSSWIAQTVIGQARFVVGPATVIGPIDIAVITWERGFQWVQRKRPNV